MKSKEVLKGHDFSREANERNRFGISQQRGFRLRCFLDAVSFAVTFDLDAGYTKSQNVRGSLSPHRAE